MTADFKNELLDRIRAALSDDSKENVIALSLVLVEQALLFRMENDTVGSPAEVKAFVHQLTGGMIDICAAGLPEHLGGQRDD